MTDIKTYSSSSIHSSTSNNHSSTSTNENEYLSSFVSSKYGNMNGGGGHAGFHTSSYESPMSSLSGLTLDHKRDTFPSIVNSIGLKKVDSFLLESHESSYLPLPQPNALTPYNNPYMMTSSSSSPSLHNNHHHHRLLEPLGYNQLIHSNPLIINPNSLPPPQSIVHSSSSNLNNNNNKSLIFNQSLNNYNNNIYPPHPNNNNSTNNIQDGIQQHQQLNNSNYTYDDYLSTLTLSCNKCTNNENISIDRLYESGVNVLPGPEDKSYEFKCSSCFKGPTQFFFKHTAKTWKEMIHTSLFNLEREKKYRFSHYREVITYVYKNPQFLLSDRDKAEIGKMKNVITATLSYNRKLFVSFARDSGMWSNYREGDRTLEDSKGLLIWTENTIEKCKKSKLPDYFHLECKNCKSNRDFDVNELETSKVLPGPIDPRFEFICSDCNHSKRPKITHLQKSWKEVAHTALFNLEREKKYRFSHQIEIASYVKEHTDSFSFNREIDNIKNRLSTVLSRYKKAFTSIGRYTGMWSNYKEGDETNQETLEFDSESDDESSSSSGSVGGSDNKKSKKEKKGRAVYPKKKNNSNSNGVVGVNGGGGSTTSSTSSSPSFCSTPSSSSKTLLNSSGGGGYITPNLNCKSKGGNMNGGGSMVVFRPTMTPSSTTSSPSPSNIFFSPTQQQPPYGSQSNHHTQQQQHHHDQSTQLPFIMNHSQQMMGSPKLSPDSSATTPLLNNSPNLANNNCFSPVVYNNGNGNSNGVNMIYSNLMNKPQIQQHPSSHHQPIPQQQLGGHPQYKQLTSYDQQQPTIQPSHTGDCFTCHKVKVIYRCKLNQFCNKSVCYECMAEMYPTFLPKNMHEWSCPSCTNQSQHHHQQQQLQPIQPIQHTYNLMLTPPPNIGYQVNHHHHHHQSMSPLPPPQQQPPQLQPPQSSSFKLKKNDEKSSSTTTNSSVKRNICETRDSNPVGQLVSSNSNRYLSNDFQPTPPLPHPSSLSTSFNSKEKRFKTSEDQISNSSSTHSNNQHGGHQLHHHHHSINDGQQSLSSSSSTFGNEWYHTTPTTQPNNNHSSSSSSPIQSSQPRFFSHPPPLPYNITPPPNHTPTNLFNNNSNSNNSNYSHHSSGMMNGMILPNFNSISTSASTMQLTPSFHHHPISSSTSPKSLSPETKCHESFYLSNH